MSELQTFIQHFGPITGLIMFMVYKQIVDMRNRTFDEAATATLTRIEEGITRIEDQLTLEAPGPITPAMEASNGTDQPPP